MAEEIYCYTAWYRYNAPHVLIRDLQSSPLVFVDTETTGLSSADVPIEIALCRVEPTGEQRWYSTLIDNGLVAINAGAAAVHGITQDMLTAAPVFSEIASTLYSLLEGAYWIGHNAKFDVSMVQRAWYAMEREPSREHLPHRGIIDTVSLTKQIIPGLQSYSLQALSRHLELPSTDRAHRALADVQTLVQLWHYLTNKQQQQQNRITTYDR